MGLSLLINKILFHYKRICLSWTSELFEGYTIPSGNRRFPSAQFEAAVIHTDFTLAMIASNFFLCQYFVVTDVCQNTCSTGSRCLYLRPLPLVDIVWGSDLEWTFVTDKFSFSYKVGPSPSTRHVRLLLHGFMHCLDIPFRLLQWRHIVRFPSKGRKINRHSEERFNCRSPLCVTVIFDYKLSLGFCIAWRQVLMHSWKAPLTNSSVTHVANRKNF